MPVCNCSGSTVSNDYVNALCREISAKLPLYNDFLCKSVYIGGGTPSLLTFSQLEQIVNTLKTCGKFEKDFEFTLEANPDDITKEFLENIFTLGINRISCGIQSMNDEVLNFINRRAKKKENKKALELLLNYWKGTLSLDLISALPYETTESFTKGIEQVINANPQHISLYSLTVEDETPLGQLINEEKIEYNYDKADEMWLLGRDLLEQKGYCQYEISNFAKKGFECKHNMTYWQHQDYLGFGSGATGTEYSGEKALRKTNTTETKKYIEYWNKGLYSEEEVVVKEEVDAETSSFEFFMMGLRTLKGVTEADYKKFFSAEIPDNIKNLFLDLQKKNLAVVEEVKNKSSITTRYALNKEGILFLNSFLEQIIP